MWNVVVGGGGEDQSNQTGQRHANNQIVALRPHSLGVTGVPPHPPQFADSIGDDFNDGCENEGLDGSVECVPAWVRSKTQKHPRGHKPGKKEVDEADRFFARKIHWIPMAVRISFGYPDVK